MRHACGPLLRLLPVMFLVVACAEPATPAEEARTPATPAKQPAKEEKPAPARVPPAEFGDPFPAGAFKDLNAAPGEAATVNLAAVLGKRPVVFCYWIPGHARSERALQDIQKLADEIGASSLAAFGVVKQRPGMETPRIRERVEALKVHLPVLDDEDFVLGQQIGVHSVPSVSILDAEGRLRLANAANLKQTLEYNMDVETAVRRVGAKGTLGTYGSLPRYYPVMELVGKKCPDFEAPAISDGTLQRWSSLMDSKRMNVLVFWSVDCPHCKKSLPAINDWLKQHPDGVNVVSAASVSGESAKAKTEEYCRLSQFVFPTLVDRDLQIGDLFQVTSTPTILVIRPDGVVDSVLLSSEANVVQALEAKKKELVAPSKS